VRQRRFLAVLVRCGQAAFLATVLLVATVGGTAGAAEVYALTVTPPGSSIQLSATLIRPDGGGPFPAVVIMHDCSGLGPRSSGSPRRWADFLVGEGYVVLIPDSFTARGLPDGLCLARVTNRANANFNVRAGDAYGALAALRRLAYVDGRRIGLMGGSHGGATTLAALAAPTRADDPLAAAKADGFAAAAALYPSCGFRYGAWSIVRENGALGPMRHHFGVYRPVVPILILAGALDDWTPADQCRALADAARQAGQPVDIVVYPDAHHAFDSAFPVRFGAERRNVNSPAGRGATTGGNAEAWADAKRQVAAFFATKLKGQ
jgi:dienelactone hydrolase